MLPLMCRGGGKMGFVQAHLTSPWYQLWPVLEGEALGILKLFSGLPTPWTSLRPLLNLTVKARWTASITSDQTPLSLAPLLALFSLFLCSILAFLFLFSSRNTNSVAHVLATRASLLTCPIDYFHVPPAVAEIIFNWNGISFFRSKKGKQVLIQ